MKKKESRTSKIVTSLIGFTCVAILMFMLGRISNSDIVEVSEPETINYVIESGYVSSEINFDEESNYIKNNFNSSMSKSIGNIEIEVSAIFNQDGSRMFSQIGSLTASPFFSINFFSIIISY